ncbi:MAG: response regulator [Salibacteraceae bacterium]|jgi:two-component system, cell cycle response regulator DivK|nr:response regulator [Salibacteraceae bacterium]MDP4935189.1 response regulator [Salibacteraceae bacterium]MDP4964447.1 response regulator [Salibacteraceae bacterium]
MAFRILYVEDDPINAYVLQKMLSNFTIDIAKNGEEGMNLSAENEYDLVLMDINLGDPEKDGVYYLKELRKTRYQKKPIVAVTAYAMSGDRERFMDAGFDEYFSKPIEKLRLLLFIEKKKKEIGS